MGLFDWIGEKLHDRSMATAYWNATRRLRARLTEEEIELKRREAKKGRHLSVPILPEPFQVDYVIPDSFMVLDHWDRDFSVDDFLAERGGALKNYLDPESGTSASTMIEQAAKAYIIDPKLLLVTLQREKSLVRRPKLAAKQLDWACGVGAWDAGAWAQKYKGFARQLDAAAQTYRNRFRQFQIDEEMTVDFGKGQVIPVNAATRALYVFTPHTSAARLTWTIWKGFFGV